MGDLGTYHRPGPLRGRPPSHSGRASWAMRRGETLGSRLVMVRVVVRSREDVGGEVDEWIRRRKSSIGTVVSSSSSKQSRFRVGGPDISTSVRRCIN